MKVGQVACSKCGHMSQTSHLRTGKGVGGNRWCALPRLHSATEQHHPISHSTKRCHKLHNSQLVYLLNMTSWDGRQQLWHCQAAAPFPEHDSAAGAVSFTQKAGCQCAFFESRPIITSLFHIFSRYFSMPAQKALVPRHLHNHSSIFAKPLSTQYFGSRTLRLAKRTLVSRCAIPHTSSSELLACTHMHFFIRAQ